jgi:acyl-CoA thioester hydrolase
MSRPALRPRAAYKHWHRITIQWNDNDVYGHVNNAVYYGWFDSAVNGFLIGHGLLDISRSDVIAYVVETTCRYNKPLVYPGEVEVGLVAAKVGTSSLSWHLGVFEPGGTDVHAEGTFTHVCVDRTTGRPTPVPAAWRRVVDEGTGPEA